MIADAIPDKLLQNIPLFRTLNPDRAPANR